MGGSCHDARSDFDMLNGATYMIDSKLPLSIVNRCSNTYYFMDSELYLIGGEDNGENRK
jgi:hypothetical protein